jgi:hypothetical protein
MERLRAHVAKDHREHQKTPLMDECTLKVHHSVAPGIHPGRWYRTGARKSFIQALGLAASMSA